MFFIEKYQLSSKYFLCFHFLLTLIFLYFLNWCPTFDIYSQNKIIVKIYLILYPSLWNFYNPNCHIFDRHIKEEKWSLILRTCNIVFLPLSFEVWRLFKEKEKLLHISKGPFDAWKTSLSWLHHVLYKSPFKIFMSTLASKVSTSLTTAQWVLPVFSVQCAFTMTSYWVNL